MTATSTCEFAPGVCGRVRDGSGPRVLWLHGYTLDSSSWEPLWDRLPGWHHVGVDLPGHGRSLPLTEDENLRTLGQRLGEFCEQHALRHLVAVSYGTTTALQIAIARPAWFASIALGAAAIAGGPRDPGVERAYLRMFQLIRQGNTGPDLVRTWMECPAWEGLERLPALREQLAAIVARHPWFELRSMSSSLRMNMPPQTDEQLGAIESPVLVLIGERDMPAFRETAERLGRTLPRGEVQTLAGLGHLCLLEAPDLAAERIARQVEACS